jgi:hypothetical protein
VPRPGTARDSVRGDPGDGHARERLVQYFVIYEPAPPVVAAAGAGLAGAPVA